jgi:hypothetical protein
MLSSKVNVKSKSRLLQPATAGPKEASEMQDVVDEEFILGLGVYEGGGGGRYHGR